MSPIFKTLLAIAIAVLLSCTHVIAYQAGKYSISRSAAAAIVGTNSPYIDLAAVAIEQAGNGIGSAYNSALREGIAQCRSAITQVNSALDSCNNKLGVLLGENQKAQAKASADAKAHAQLVVKYDDWLAGPCSHWAAQPICPQLLNTPLP